MQGRVEWQHPSLQQVGEAVRSSKGCGVHRRGRCDDDVLFSIPEEGGGSSGDARGDARDVGVHCGAVDAAVELRNREPSMSLLPVHGGRQVAARSLQKIIVFEYELCPCASSGVVTEPSSHP